MSNFKVSIINGKAPSGGVGGASDADLSSLAVDFLNAGALNLDSFQLQPPVGTSKTVTVKAGIYYAVNPSATMIYKVVLDADQTVTIPDNASGNPRLDAVALKVDLGVTPNNVADNVATLIEVQGTPAGSPSAPTDAAINTAAGGGNFAVRLGNVAAASGFTTINSGDITDFRNLAYFQNENGWANAHETWAYLSANTITVPSDARTKYSVGDPIKLTQSGVVKYFWVVGVAATVLTISPGMDNAVPSNQVTLANSAISNNYYSKATNPVGFPTVFAYTPTIVGFSANPSTVAAKFRIIGKTCTFWIATNNGTSNATSLTYTIPITAKTESGNAWRSFGKAVDNSIALTTVGLAEIASGGTTVVCYKDGAGSGWTASGAKNFQLAALTYEI